MGVCNICSSLPTVFFSYLPYRIFKECNSPLANVGHQGDSAAPCRRRADIGLNRAEVVGQELQKLEQASIHSPSLKESPLGPHTTSGLAAHANKTGTGPDTIHDSHAVHILTSTLTHQNAEHCIKCFDS